MEVGSYMQRYSLVAKNTDAITFSGLNIQL